MNRTQIYISEKQLRFLKRRAFEKDTSISEAIRDLINQELEKSSRYHGYSKSRNTGDWLESLASEAKKLKISGPKDLASQLDKYLYGQK